MAKKIDELTFDLRTLDRLLQNGTISKKDYEGYLASLPDSQSQGEYIQIELERSARSTDEPTPHAQSLTFSPADDPSNEPTSDPTR